MKTPTQWEETWKIYIYFLISRDGINIKLNTAKEKIIELETSKQNQPKESSKKKKKKTFTNEQSLSDLWDNVKWPNIIGAPPKNEGGKGKIFEEIITETFPNLILFKNFNYNNVLWGL